MELRIFRCRREVVCWNGVHEDQTVDVLQYRDSQHDDWRDVPTVREKRIDGDRTP